VELPDGVEIITLACFVLTQYWLVTDGQTDGHVGQTDTFLLLMAKTRASNSIASRE